MKGLKTAVILSGVALIGFGLYRFYKMQVDFLKNIEYKITSIKIKTMTKQLLSIDVSMRLFNYSNIDATVKEIFLDFYIKHYYLLKLLCQYIFYLSLLLRFLLDNRYSVLNSQVPRVRK